MGALQPKRERLEEAAAAAKGLTEPAEAWEAMATAGLIRPEDVDDPQRSFRDPISLVKIEQVRDEATGQLVLRAWTRTRSGLRFEERRPLDGLARVEGRRRVQLWIKLQREADEAVRAAARARPLLLRPLTVSDCVAFGADWPAVLAAESAAQQHVANSGWYRAAQRRVAWRVMRRKETEGCRAERETDARIEAEDSARNGMDEARRRINALGYVFDGVHGRAIELSCPAL